MIDASAVPVRLAPARRAPRGSRRTVRLRSAAAAEAAAIHALIVDHLEEGHLLPRTLDQIASRVDRFVVAAQGTAILACAELAPLSGAVAEVRSLVVGRHARRLGLGRRIVAELVRRAETAGFHKLCAFTHSPGYFVHMGFSIVPHVWLPEKIAADCHACPLFRRCGQYAVLRPLAQARDGCVPLSALHG